MDNQRPFVGTGENPEGPDLPIGFGMQLVGEPGAMDFYSSLSQPQKENVIRFVQSGATGQEAEYRVAEAVQLLKQHRLDEFHAY